MILNKIVYDNVTVFNLLVGASTFIIALVAAKALSVYLRRFLKDRLSKEHLEIVVKLVYYGIIIIAVLSVLPNIGVKLSGLLVAGGVAGLAIGFASQSIIGNLISGLFLIIERPIKLGNAVSVEGTIGIVEDIRIMSTSLRTFDGLYIRVPNQKVFNANLTNYVAHPVRRLEYTIGIRYSDDAPKAIQIIKDLIGAHPLALVNPEPLVFVDHLGDSAVNIIVRVWTPTSEWLAVKTELLWTIKVSLEGEGIEIPFPQRVVWFANDSEKKQNGEALNAVPESEQ